jgi:ABC-type uncharacterized transport system fused permease/ATPase subunit
MYYIPQRPYLVSGSLRDQVIYPDSYEDMINKNLNDSDIMNIFEWVNLVHIAKREGGLNSICEWKDILSGIFIIENRW